MSKLISYRAQVEVSNKVQDILRNYIIKDWHSEPPSALSNAAERYYQDAKWLASTVLDLPEAPPLIWLLALTYVYMCCNIHLPCLCCGSNPEYCGYGHAIR